MLSSLLTNNKKTKAVDQLFQKQIEIIDDAPIDQIEEEEEEEQQKQQIKESDTKRQQRTLYVGNVDIEATKGDITKLFKQYGEIDKVWFRSIPVDTATKSSRMPIKAAVILGKFTDGAKTKICYILFKDPSSAKAATKQDGQLFKSNHLRCSLDGQKKLDHIRTAFVGNLPYQIEEDEVRSVFEQFGEIQYVRVIKDPYTHQSKGFGYVCFKEFLSLKKALQAESVLLKDREIRIKKASEQTKTSGKIETNPKNAFRRIASKDDGQNQRKQKKNNTNLVIKKKVKKMRKKNYTKSDITKQVDNIKQQSKREIKDSNIFNQY